MEKKDLDGDASISSGFGLDLNQYNDFTFTSNWKGDELHENHRNVYEK